MRVPGPIIKCLPALSSAVWLTSACGFIGIEEIFQDGDGRATDPNDDVTIDTANDSGASHGIDAGTEGPGNISPPGDTATEASTPSDIGQDTVQPGDTAQDTGPSDDTAADTGNHGYDRYKRAN